MSVEPTPWIAGAAGAPISQAQTSAAGSAKQAAQAAEQTTECQASTDREGDGPLPYQPNQTGNRKAAGASRDASGTRGNNLDLTG